MFEMPIKQFFNIVDFGRSIRLFKNDGSYKKYVYSCTVNRFQWSKADDDEFKGQKEFDKLDKTPAKYDSGNSGDSSGEDDVSTENHTWKSDIAWISKALEPALQLWKWAVPTGNGNVYKPPPTERSLSDIFASIQRSKLGIQDWSLSDLTFGLYLIYLQQASTGATEDVKGELVSSEAIVQYLIYHIELAKGSYKDNAAGLARHSMIRENHTVKFIKDSSVLRPGYFIGLDMRKKLVILGIRGTHTVYDLVTDIISSSHEEIAFEGYSTHFGAAEAARWFLTHEIVTLRKCLEKHKGFKLRLVGHSLGGATASLLAIMLRKKSLKELGFNPEIIDAVAYAPPPCVSRELAESCSDFVTTVVMQDDMIPRLSIGSISRLRNEIVETDWVTVFEREDWKGVIDLVTNAKQVVSSVQDVARKLADYTNFRGQTENSDTDKKKEVPKVPSEKKEVPKVPSDSHGSNPAKDQGQPPKLADLFVPGTVYYLERNTDAGRNSRSSEYFTLFRRYPGEHFQRILLSSNIFSDHKCESHYYALRDVLKGLPPPSDDTTF
ncbi:sn1-specific diacylglycerol lipase beta-like [Dorcoceras hygrometricum]|uniref:Sn1-specific diacylglycerol lipase beta-like n=1 Tax=Dorcoceras hygrometricum TaxID=472368 RepID=A0A2Z7BLZ7_9LAMI|nr:sn1-specific diacylglycerol lipase beta-like [Dorcoceras hygrometricum]